MSFIENLEASLHQGFIDQEKTSYGNYKPKLLINNKEKNENVLATLLEELNHCQSFLFSVAFITESGLATLKSHLLDLKRKGIKGRILTSTFLNFNQPKVFRELLKVTNIEVRLANIAGFHSKGYIFEQSSHYSLIIGSSNLTAQALKANYEWNVKLTSHGNGEIISHFNQQFEDVWENAQPLTEEWITTYERDYTPPTTFSNPEKVAELPVPYQVNPVQEAVKIEPNKMQKAALQKILAVREAGEERGLVVSATGTGKTYLSAFDVRRFAPKRMLFVVHREQILQKAKSDFMRILGGIESDFGILSGSSKQSSARYVFATIQTISKEENLKQFDPAAFDYILIDEVHKAGAKSYLRVIDHFKPNFLMGMTATPERTDEFNIYELFNYNVAYEIRLQEALEEDMLCPFHYFGVTDLEIDGEVTDEAVILTKLVTEERINHILEKIHYYGFSGDRVRGLMFCSRKEEVGRLSRALNERGLRTVGLTGGDSQEERIRQVERLENGELDYILTVDIFNEGIDIPSINQVVMLRQTESSIIFVQQLGRGLRKHNSKDFVTIIDFIGNYRNNYLIPVALSGDRSQNKDNVRRHVKDTSYIKGISTVNFEAVAKERVFSSINSSNLTQFKLLREAFIELKNRLGRRPMLVDFVTNHSIDPKVLVQKPYFNYYQFLLKVKEIEPSLSDYENSVLTMFSQEILNGKRLHEIILLELLLKSKTVSMENYMYQLSMANCELTQEVLNSVKRIFNLDFFTQNARVKYGQQSIIKLKNNEFFLNEDLRMSLATNTFFREMVIDIGKSARQLNSKYNRDKSLTLYEKYTRKDVCRLLDWDKDETSTVYGYRVKHNTCPIFITYHKRKEVESNINYEDKFLSPEILKWFTKNNRTLASEEVKAIIRAQELGITIHIFVQKYDKEESFYYLGKAIPDQRSVEQTSIFDKKGKELPIVTMNLNLEQSIEYQLYDYLVTNEDQKSTT
ncbi:DUF3427 domain-containing protein [Planococcus lenghuensis]|uniref:NgoFVII family restriction endonuclease n=1 Tax=Planococcus lenghuensis TaxID=2213202 RepID=A0A1Q2L4H2_9BACL|nr:DEAD/DEAH box helicase [Planococcus lenghuensis]AQQ54762.1 NgoFVII family restriction endonuclease [Planococcus lenghuensis]